MPRLSTLIAPRQPSFAGASGLYLRRRRGISLMEVLMSIFIISIGIIGVLSLIYLAHYQADRGAIADRAATAGQAALRSFKAQGMENPSAWRTPAGAIISVDPTGASDALKPMQLGFAKKYCLDPRGCARAGIPTTFPNGGTVTMPRITLYNGISLTAATNIMQPQQADQFFCLQDDLHFTVVENDPAAVPVQTLEATNAKRFAARDFSWLATLVREQPGEQYTLSVAVVQGRNGTTAAEFAAFETEFSVTFLGGGVSGGDVTLTSVAATKPALEALVPGRWIMLTQADRARWYRVIALSEMNGLTRDVTLAGRDWGIDATYTASSAKAAILMNVVGVYERTVRLKTNSLWQQ